MKQLACILALLLCTALAHAQPATQPTTAPTSQPAYVRGSIGQNIGGETDYSRTKLLINAAKTARTPELATINGVAGLRWVMFTEGTADWNGTYHWSCRGNVAMKTTGGSPATIFNVRYVPETDTTTADIAVGAKPGQTAQLHLFFPGLTEAPKDAKLLRPGYASDAATFTDEFLSLVRKTNTGLLRGMELLDTNGSTIAKWEDRVKPEDLVYTVPGRGAPYELLIDLCNATECDLWLNIPHAAGDDFVSALAALVRSRLKSTLAVHVERGNEVWNTDRSFNIATQYAKDQAAKEGLTYRQWYAKRLCLDADIFRDEFGIDAYRVRPVLSGQWANPDILQQSIDWITKNRGPLKDNVYAIAVAPYFGSDATQDARKDLTVESYLGGNPSWLWSAMDSLLHHRKTLAFLQQAKDNGVVPMCYETALSLHAKNSPGVVQAVNRDPRVRDIMAEFYRTWFEWGGGPVCYFTICSEWTDAKCYGLVESVVGGGPKLDAVAAVSAAHPLLFAHSPLEERLVELQKKLTLSETENAQLREDNQRYSAERFKLRDTLNTLAEGIK